MNKKWLILISGFLLSSLEGIAFTWGIMILPLVDEFAWSQAEASAPLGIFMVTSIVTLIIAGHFQDKYGASKVSAIGGLLFIAGYALTSMVEIFPNPWWVNFSYGIVTGSASGVTYACIVPPISKWFSKNTAFATSLALMGSGISTLTFAPIKAGFLIPLLGVSGTFVATGILVSLITFIAAWLSNKAEKHEPAAIKNIRNTLPLETEQSVKSDVQPSAMLKTTSFWMIWFMYLLAATGGFIALSLFPVYGEHSLGMTASDTALSLSLFSLANAFGRPIAGKLADSYGMLKVVIISYFLQAIAYIVLVVSGGFDLPLHLTSIIIGFSFAVSLAVFPVFVGNLFGLRNLGVNYGILSTAYGLAAISPSLGFMLHEHFGSYTFVLLCVGLMSAIASCIGLLMKKNDPANVH